MPCEFLHNIQPGGGVAADACIEAERPPAAAILTNSDGGLAIRIQHDPPADDLEANWLPAPAEGFFLVMRMYQPEDRMYRGDYIVPAVTRRG